MRKKVLAVCCLVNCVFVFNMLAHAQSNESNPRSIATILSDSRKKFDVDFVYQSTILPTDKISFDENSFASVDLLLKALLTPYKLNYSKVLSKAYIIFKDKTDLLNMAEVIRQQNGGVLPADFPTSGLSFGKFITGNIKDKTSGIGLAGVSVALKSNPAKGTITDNSGSFKIETANDKEALLVSFIGYEAQQIKATPGDNIQITLSSQTQTLNDVVVIGYGTRKKKDLTSSISSVSGKEINGLPVSDAGQALQGKVSGVVITQGSGAPGGTGGTQIRIRGFSSVTGTNNPLIVLDGFPLPDQSADNVLNSFNVNEIESIDVLKDASAASIYGVRGSNGVIMITTKRGKAGKTVFNIDVYRGIQKAWYLPTLLDAREYSVINTEARIASNLPVIPKVADPSTVEQIYGGGTDWLKQVFRYAAIQNVAISMSGGSEIAQYAVSANYMKQDGIVYSTDFERFNLRFNGDLKISKKFKVGNSITLTKNIEHGKDTYSAFNSVLLLALTAPPTVKPYNDDGSYAGGQGNIDGFSEPNPVYNLEVPKFTNTRYRITGTVFGEYEPITGLKFKTNLGGDMVVQRLNGYNPATPSTGGQPISTTSVFEQAIINPSYVAELTAGYEHTFNDHNISGLIGYTAQDNSFYYLGAGRSGYTRLGFPVLDDNILVPANTSQTFNFDSYGRTRLLSYIGRVNYSYKGRYLLNATIRKDGSSNFGPNNRFAIFPSASFAWRIIEEPFMQSSNLFTDLKLRTSYGFTGNQNISGFAYLAKINSGIQYPFGNSSGTGGTTSGAAPTATANPDLRWEKNEQINIGIDAAILNNKISISLDVYQRKSIDLIFNVVPPTVSGTYESIPLNTGTMENKGIDMSLNTVNLSNKNFKWNSTIIISAFKNEVKSLGLSGPINNSFTRIQGGSSRVSTGDPAFYFFGYKTEGIFQNYKEIQEHAVQVAGTDPSQSTAPGDIKFVDLNKDGIINDLDRTNLGNSYPTFTYGFTNNFTYKDFQLTLFIQGSQGNKVLNFTRWYTEGGVSNGNYSVDVLGRWTGEGTSNSMPRVILNDPNQNNRVSDRFVEDASYLRIKNVRLTYSVPQKWSNFTGLKKFQVYASAQNLLTFTKYKGMDPEVGNGVDYGFYPQSRTLLFGLNIDL